MTILFLMKNMQILSIKTRATVCSVLFICFVISCSGDDTTKIADNDTIEVDDDTEHGEIGAFKVMSYNISGNTWNSHKDSLMAVIKRNTIDILGAQELSGTIKSEFMSLLGTNFSLIETFPSNTNTSTHNIVYNNQTFSVVDFGYFETEFCGSQRFINWALLEKLDDMQQYYVYNNHLCNSDLELRKQHLVDLTDLMETHTQATTDYKAIICGDFNSTGSSEYIQYMLGNGSLTIGQDLFLNPLTLIDTWDAINPNTTKPSQGNVSIDWIFSTPNLDIASASVDLSSVNAQGEYPSQHSPIITNFNY